MTCLFVKTCINAQVTQHQQQLMKTVLSGILIHWQTTCMLLSCRGQEDCTAASDQQRTHKGAMSDRLSLLTWRNFCGS